MATMIPAGKILTRLAEQEPDRPAVTCGSTTLSRAELDALSNRLARSYADRGVGAGDFVTLALPNSVEFLAATFAVWKLGAVPQPASARLPTRELQAIVQLAGSALVVGVEADHLPGHATVAPDFQVDETVSDAPLPESPIPPALKAPTSGGSTGRPKLIVSGRSGEVDPEEGLAFGLEPDDVHLVPGPMYHNAPFAFATLATFTGNHVIILPRFDPVAALDAIDRFGVNVTNLVPTMMQRMLNVVKEDPTRFDLSSLRRVWHMAAPCPAWVKEAWIELVGPETVYELYGGTEAQSITVINGTEWLQRRGSVGRPVIGEMTILDDEHRPLPPGEVGEIYMRRPDGTPPTYRYIGAETREHAGWESLGDLGHMDEDGYLYLSDRRTDMIVTGGANVYPAEVEAALSEHPAIDSSVVVGLPDEDLGQVIHAVVQTSEEVSEAEVGRFLESRLVRYKRPRSIRFVRDPLRDDAGKTRRAQIRDQEIERLSVRSASSAST